MKEARARGWISPDGKTKYKEYIFEREREREKEKNQYLWHTLTT